MDRKQAVAVIKQIFEHCSEIEGKSIKLMPPKEGNGLSNTFQIHIQINNDEFLKRCIETIAKEHNLATKEKNGLIVVYKPYPNIAEPI
jgi:hypothetical protein